MRHLHVSPSVVVLLGAALLVGQVLLGACNKTSPGGGDDNDMGANQGDSGNSSPPDMTGDLNDPPIMYCELDGGMFTVPDALFGGTAACPSDKNLPGCPCPAPGVTAACWPGLRKDRGVGICTDGQTTCQAANEVENQWGPCIGAVLPVPGATGKEACECFSSGQWKLTDLEPCFYEFNGGASGSGGVTSSVLANGSIQCQQFNSPPVMTPAQPWSDDTVTADCEGHFKLCYALKAGKAASPTPNDCTIAQVCTQGDYLTTNVAQAFPPLPAFAVSSPAAEACAQQFLTSGGYGEMSVNGTTIDCVQLDKVFNRVSYCPLTCNQADMGSNPLCTNCMAGGSGTF